MTTRSGRAFRRPPTPEATSGDGEQEFLLAQEEPEVGEGAAVVGPEGQNEQAVEVGVGGQLVARRNVSTGIQSAVQLDVREYVSNQVWAMGDAIRGDMKQLHDAVAMMQESMRIMQVSPQTPQTNPPPATTVSYALSQPGKETKPRPFDGSVDWESYYRQFEMIARKNRWDDETKVTELGAALCGPAVTVLSGLPRLVLYPALVEALEARYGVRNQTQLYLALLQSRVQQPEEGIVEYHREMREIGRKAWPDSHDGSLEGTLALHFVKGLWNDRIRERVLTVWPQTMQEALTVALRMEAVCRLTNVPIRSAQTTEECGFVARVFRCYRCDKPGHSFRDCPTNKRKLQSPVDDPSGNEPRSD
ncbi:hypothetical protein GE061_003031 [Apolygus lucorum]|uniref:Uncharacterized protein n=2 Tax=Apolygus lucorum TaxID=248454 RepID=A0A6A4JU04_APOLU|nr:hypothetical protein GE061_003031 [Apolygus lucorum]